MDVLDNSPKHEKERGLWWAEKRIPYNLGLIISGVLAYITYSIVVKLFVPFDAGDGFFILELLIQGIGYIVMMIIANVLYSLGSLTEKIVNPKNAEKFRKNLFRFGFCFSCFLPFMIPILVFIKHY